MVERIRPARIGAILPDDGPFDYEWLRPEGWLPALFPGTELLVERSPADGLMLTANLCAIGRGEVLEPPARRLCQRGAEVIVWACTSGSFAGGYQRARQQVAELAAATLLPATSTSIALAEGALSLGVKAIDLLSAYNIEVTSLLMDFLEQSGVNVHEVWTLDCVQTEESFAIDIVAEVGAFVAAVPGTRPILVPDTAINTVLLQPQLQAVAGRPVITANQASLWHALRLLGRTDAHVLGPFG